MKPTSKNSSLQQNILIHNRIATSYEAAHGEIYNEVEQSRLQKTLVKAISFIDSDISRKTVLDFGCGAGNLTRHLTDLGCDVIACDVAQGFLDLIGSRVYNTVVRPFKLNGLDLSGIPNASVDMVATYSVLHHIPDYLGILKEFMRVLKPGGIIFIDHEPSDEYWLRSNLYADFNREMTKYIKINWRKYFVVSNYYDWLIRKFINPRYHREGDIHVFDDDHVEWAKVVESLSKDGGQVVFERDYLLFRRNYHMPTFNKYESKISDMHVLIFKKNK